jgi:hypothetical protein
MWIPAKEPLQPRLLTNSQAFLFRVGAFPASAWEQA